MIHGQLLAGGSLENIDINKAKRAYGEKFEDSEGKQIFLEFADEERNHLDLLVREYRALAKRQGCSPRR